MLIIPRNELTSKVKKCSWHAFSEKTINWLIRNYVSNINLFLGPECEKNQNQFRVRIQRRNRKRELFCLSTLHSPIKQSRICSKGMYFYFNKILRWRSLVLEVKLWSSLQNAICHLKTDVKNFILNYSFM